MVFNLRYFRKSATFEGLEIDQYIWSVLQNKQTIEFDEVTIDQNAKIKPCLPTTVKVIRAYRFISILQVFCAAKIRRLEMIYFITL